MEKDRLSRLIPDSWQKGARSVEAVAIVGLLAAVKRVFIHRHTPHERGGWRALEDLPPTHRLHVATEPLNLRGVPSEPIPETAAVQPQPEPTEAA